MLSKVKKIGHALILLNVCHLTATDLHNGFYDVMNGTERVAKIFICTDGTPSDDGDVTHSSIYQAAIAFPHIMESVNETTPLFLFVPPVLKNVSSIDDNAPWLEGARVAMAWASAFFRFNKHTKIKIIEVPFNVCQTLNEDIVKAIVCSMHVEEKGIHSTITPEQAMYQRIVPFARVDQKTAQDFSHFTVDSNKSTLLAELSVKILHTLPALKKEQKRFLITGVAGFLGSHLARKILAEGHQVVGIDNLICSSGENIQDLVADENFNFIKHDVSVPFHVDGPLYEVVHLASLPSPAFYYAMPVETLRSGLQGAFVTAELALQKGARYFFSSTSEVYGDPEVTPQVETYYGNVDPIGKRSQYDESKRGVEALLTLYYKKGLDIRIARIFNSYGPGMELNDGRVVTNFIGALLEHKPMVIYGDGTQTRSFCYVSDTVNGLYSLLMSDVFQTSESLLDRVVNIGNDGEFTVNELAEKANALACSCGYQEVEIKRISAIDATDPKTRKPSLEKANRLLHYAPVVPLDDGFERTFTYFQERSK